MSQENVELARRGYEALMRGDLDAVAELFAPDLTWEWWRQGPWDCHSREEAMTVIRERIGQRAIGELQEIIDVDDERIVVVMGHDGSANVVTVRDGKVVTMRDYRTEAEALGAVGLRE